MAEAPAEASTAPDEPGAGGDSARAAISEEEVSALLENDATDAVVAFDLSSRRISRTQLPMLEYLCRNFAERVASSLSGLLSREVIMQFDALQSAKTADLQSALPFPASLAVIRIKPLPGLGFVSVDPSLLLVLLDVFFGGQGRATSDPQAAAAPAAQRFLALLVRNFAADLTAAWAPIAPVELELVKQETNPRFAQMGDPNSMMIAAKFSVTFGTTNGHIDWLLPESLLAPIREALASESGKPAARAQAAWAPALGAMLQRAEIEARAILAEAQISLGDLVRLVPGDVIPIEAPQQVMLLAGDVPLYRGKFGVSQGRNALKILARGSA
ncbi:MAG: FliM/FliN family flagellar motor switch protein [Steroidobacteraceae bacterium]|jgi:flagellar motor switch protein FliM